MALALWCLGKGVWVQLTYGEGDKSLTLLQCPIGIQKVVRVEGVWFFEVKWVVESRAQDGIYFSVLKESHKMERYCHSLPNPTP